MGSTPPYPRRTAGAQIAKAMPLSPFFPPAPPASFAQTRLDACMTHPIIAATPASPAASGTVARLTLVADNHDHRANDTIRQRPAKFTELCLEARTNRNGWTAWVFQ